MGSSEQAIANLVYTYAERIDVGDLAGVAALFAQATYRSDRGGHYQGAREVLDALERAVILHGGTPRTKHVTTNLIVEVDEVTGTAIARSYFTVLQATQSLPLQPILTGRYHDRFARSDEAWRFIDRYIMLDQVGSLGEHVKRNLG